MCIHYSILLARRYCLIRSGADNCSYVSLIYWEKISFKPSLWCWVLLRGLCILGELRTSCSCCNIELRDIGRAFCSMWKYVCIQHYINYAVSLITSTLFNIWIPRCWMTLRSHKLFFSNCNETYLILADRREISVKSPV